MRHTILFVAILVLSGTASATVAPWDGHGDETCENPQLDDRCSEADVRTTLEAPRCHPLLEAGNGAETCRDTPSPGVTLAPAASADAGSPGDVSAQSHTNDDAECRVASPPGTQVSCQDTWDQPNEGSVPFSDHAGIHTIPFAIGASGTVKMTLETTGGHTWWTFECNPVLLGDNDFVQCTRSHDGHYHVGTQIMTVTGQVDSGFEQCLGDRLFGRAGPCEVHGSFSLG